MKEALFECIKSPYFVSTIDDTYDLANYIVRNLYRICRTTYVEVINEKK